MYPKIPTKSVLAIVPQSVTNGATASGIIDTLGFAHANIKVLQGNSNNVTNNLSVCRISEAETTDATNFGTITKFEGDNTTAGFTIPNAVTATDNGQVYDINIDLRGRKRYLRVQLSPVTTQILTAVADLSRAQVSPSTAAQAGAAVVVNG